MFTEMETTVSKCLSIKKRFHLMKESVSSRIGMPAEESSFRKDGAEFTRVSIVGKRVLIGGKLRVKRLIVREPVRESKAERIRKFLVDRLRTSREWCLLNCKLSRDNLLLGMSVVMFAVVCVLIHDRITPVPSFEIVEVDTVEVTTEGDKAEGGPRFEAS